MKFIAIAVAAMLLTGCPAPERQPRHFVHCVSPDGREVQTQTLDFWVYEDGGWNGYNYASGLAVTVNRVAVYVPVQGSVCYVMEVR